MKWIARIFFAICLCITFGAFITGCNYHFGYGDLSNRYRTISIPYAEGDNEGRLTVEVIRKISTSGAFRFVTYGGDLTLKIKLLDLTDENIGFRYDRHKNGCLKKTLIPTETRLIATTEIILIESSTNQIVKGPIEITASVDFDHDFYSSRNAINIFSLGQLTDIDAAQDTAMNSLNRELADKISNFIINSW